MDTTTPAVLPLRQRMIEDMLQSVHVPRTLPVVLGRDEVVRLPSSAKTITPARCLSLHHRPSSAGTAATR